MKLKDKVEIYEWALKNLAALDIEKLKEDILKQSPSDECKYCFGFGWFTSELGTHISRAKYALEQGRVK